ncbi:MAG: hypothetical protein GTN62_11305 [Gemmatimonadales bacterium]|nr:hypothetical protein [Gemmatimonadales bacterium]NIN50681.1 hypothetical protein [Gemmatimonadales bacterium]NIP08145.1 hypothetical protein [Gemmatimonadales bacterium]NIR01023.1 hypothetical protein [Gemmatimonadales bacterium]NIS65102.1 hypothetical protein [Gemmatimonadales bacterium]
MNKALALLIAAALTAGPAAAQDPAPIVSQAAGGYTLQPGDVVRINVWGHEEYSGQFQVDEEGRIHYPILGAIHTSNMTVAALRDTLRAGLERLFTNPFVTLTPLFRIAVLGEVQTPGLYTVDPTLSVLDIVALAGGATRVGNLGKIRVFRSGAETRFSFEQATIRGRTLQEIGVRSGDEIIVPRKFFAREDFTILLQLLQIGLSIAIFVNTL